MSQRPLAFLSLIASKIDPGATGGRSVEAHDQADELRPREKRRSPPANDVFGTDGKREISSRLPVGERVAQSAAPGSTAECAAARSRRRRITAVARHCAASGRTGIATAFCPLPRSVAASGPSPERRRRVLSGLGGRKRGTPRLRLRAPAVRQEHGDERQNRRAAEISAIQETRRRTLGDARKAIQVVLAPSWSS